MHCTVAANPRQQTLLLLRLNTIIMNKIRTQKFHQFWLKITAIVVGSFGPVFFLGTMAATAEPARLTLDLLSWPVDGATTYTAADTRFLSALTGGFLLGWGVMIWCLSSLVYNKAPEAIRKTVLASVLSWFILDSAGSVASGNPSNALLNIIVLLIAVGPLWLPAKR
jgi:biotin transporter BioY